MKYVPRVLKENVNISRASPLRELVFLLGVIAGILLVIYIGLGIALNYIVDNINPEQEARIGKLLFPPQIYPQDKNVEKKEKIIQQILDKLVKHLPPPYNQRKYHIHVIKNEEVNALALPGNQIIIFTGLLKEVKSENELAFVLAHELGHIVHRDHLRVLGRQLVMLLLATVLLGTDNTITNFLTPTLSTAERKFSRTQEIRADKFALELIYTTYGHVGGAVDFMNHIKGKLKLPRLSKFFLTHPFPEERIRILESVIKEKNYSLKAVTPLNIP